MSINFRPKFSDIPFSWLPATLSKSVANPFANLLRSVDIELKYLIELHPFDTEKVLSVSGLPFSTKPFSWRPVTDFRGGITKVYLSDKGFYTKTSDTPSNTSYLPLVDNPFQFDVSILNGREFRGGVPAFGAIRIAANNGELDSILDFLWSGRQVTIYAGEKNFQRAEFEAVFKGIVSDIEYDEEEIIVNLSDKSQILRTSFDQSLYEGTGGVEGGDDVKGDVKPLCYGEVKNVPLKLIDAANNIYQAHDGSIQSVDAVYDRGVSLAFDGDVADITAASVAAAKYRTQLTGGYIKLGSTPAGLVTADIKGCNASSYINKAGAILSRLVKTKLGSQNFDGDSVAQGDLNTFDAALTAPIGVFIDRKTTLNDVLDNIFINLGAYWYFKRTGDISAGLIDTPSNPVLTVDENQILDDSFEALEVIPAAWRITAGYNKAWKVQTLEELAPAATSAQKEFASQEYRKLVSVSSIIRGQTLRNHEIQFNSLIINEADAQDFMDRLKRIYQTRRTVYRFKAADILFKVFIGDAITVKYPRYGLESGKTFIITSISEDAQDNETEIEVWG